MTFWLTFLGSQKTLQWNLKCLWIFKYKVLLDLTVGGNSIAAYFVYLKRTSSPHMSSQSYIIIL